MLPRSLEKRFDGRGMFCKQESGSPEVMMRPHCQKSLVKKCVCLAKACHLVCVLIMVYSI